MEKTFLTPNGIIIRKLTTDEVNDFAKEGDILAKKELYKSKTKNNTEERLIAIENYLFGD